MAGVPKDKPDGLVKKGWKETRAHFLTNECHHGRDITTATGSDIQHMSKAHAPKEKDM
jgi:hypothetical protein